MSPVRSCLFELTFRCNLACRHCYLPARARRGRAAPLAAPTVGRILDRVARQGTLHLALTGGEPLLHPGFASIYRQAVARGFLVTVMTNGTLIGESVADLFAQAPPYRVEVTVHAMDAQVHDRITRKPGSYQAALRGIGRLARQRIPLVIKTIVMKQNRDHVLAVREFARSLPDARFRLDPVVVAGLDGSRAPLACRLAPRAIARLERSDPELRQEIAASVRSSRRRKPTGELFPCARRIDSFLIDPAGRIGHCYLVRAPGLDIDARSGAFVGLAALRRALAGVRLPSDSACRTCRLRLACRSCPARAALETRGPGWVSPYLCRLARSEAAGLPG